MKYLPVIISLKNLIYLWQRHEVLWALAKQILHGGDGGGFTRV